MTSLNWTSGRASWRALAAIWLLALSLFAGASPAQAQIYRGNQAPTQRGVYFLGYLDYNGELHADSSTFTPGVAIQGKCMSPSAPPPAIT